MEETRNQVITNLRACLISSQGGIPANSLNNDYRHLLGELIPHRKLGYNSLEAFLRSIPEISLTTVNGEIFVEAKKTASSNHISQLVEKQKRTGRKRWKKSQLKRPARPKGSKQFSVVPPRFRQHPKTTKPKAVSQPPPAAKIKQESDTCTRRDQNSTPASRGLHRPPPLYVPFQHHQPLLNVGPSIPYKPFQNRVYFSPPPPLMTSDFEPSLILKQQSAELEQLFYYQQKAPIPPLMPKILPPKKRPPPSAQRNKSKFEWLPIPLEISEGSHYKKLLDFIHNRGWPEPDVNLLRQTGGFVTCMVSVKCSKPGERSELYQDELEFTTYPQEYVDPNIALEEGSKKAYERILQRTSEDFPITKDHKMILNRLSEMVGEKTNGIWAFQLERDYNKKFQESLPLKWLDIVNNSNILCASNLGYSYVVKPLTDEERLDNITSKKNNFENLMIPKLNIPETNQWDVYVSKAHSYSEIWIRIIGEDYNQQLENLTTDMELYYISDKSPPLTKVEVGKYYAATCDDSLYRIIIKEIYENEALVHFVDYGDDEILQFKAIKILNPKFYKLPSQALLVNLSSVEYTSKIEYKEEIMNKIVGKSYIALVEERDPFYLVLYDTSDDNDVDINEKLICNIFSTLYKPTLLEVGAVKEVRISHIDNDGQVFIKLVSTPALDFLNERLEAMNRGECEMFKIEQINFDRIYLIKHKDQVYRVIVSPKNFSKQDVIVNFIDEGRTETVSAPDLFEVADPYDILSSIPHQALKIYLKDIPPFKLTKRKIDKLREIAPPNRSIISKVVEVTDLPVLELFIRNQLDKLLSSVNHSIELEDLLESSNGRTDLNQSLGNLKISEKPKKVQFSPLQRSISATMPTHLDDRDIYSWFGEDFLAAHMTEVPPVGEKYFEIFVADAANPTNFTVQPLKYLSALNKQTKEMKHFYDNTKPTVYSPLQHVVYAVLQPDGFWYRACVYRIFNNDITVKLCDFGNLDVISLQKLRPLHKKFMELPFLGLKATLAGIVPKHKDWSVNDCLSLKQMIKGKKLISEIKEVTYEKGEMILSLEIIDTNSTNDINISHLLVLEGRAVYK